MFGLSVLAATVFIFGAVVMVHTEDAAITVDMFDKPAIFHPDPVKINVGRTITWVNKGETVHTVTTDASQAPDPSWVSAPKGAEVIDSGYLNTGETYSYTFKLPGVYKYFCLTHEQEGMKGEVDVAK
jgi:plastocyanin